MRSILATYFQISMEEFSFPKHVLIIKNEEKEYTISLESTTYSIGRAYENLIVIDAPEISRYHATLLRIATSAHDNYRFRIIDGDLNSKRSRNGIKVNGNTCFSHDLEHGDIINFAKNITAVYQAESVLKPAAVSNSSSHFGDDEDIDYTVAVKSSHRNSSAAFSKSSDTLHQKPNVSIQQSLERLASFPELFSNPIIEIDLQGNITYINPAAIKSFPTLEQDKLDHPLLNGVVDLAKVVKEKSFIREVKIANQIFEQSIHLVPASQLLRCYISDITQRKKTESLLKKAHKELEKRVEERTQELVYNNDILRLEIAERKQKEQEIILLQTITQAITEASNFDEAISITLRKVCETIDWNFGEAWIPDTEEKNLKLSPAWYSNADNLDCFRTSSKKFVYPLEVGQPGRIWATKKSEWIEDISLQTKEISPRYKLSQTLGLKTALGVPMIANEEVIAILIFFNFSTHVKNHKMLKLVESVAAQLGLIIERKKAEDALRSSMATNKAILNAIPDLILRVDRQGIFVNYKAGKTHSLLNPEKQFLGKHIHEVFPLEMSVPMINSIERIFDTGEVQILEFQISNKGKTNSYEVRIAISDIDEIMAIVRDITDRKRAEEDISRTLEQQKKLNELKSRFVTMTSHEFRTPLASILSSSELLEHYSHKWSEPKKLSHLYRIQESVKHMTELLNDVLLLGKADAGKLELKPTKVNLIQFCQKLVEEFALTTQTHSINFKVENCLQTNNLTQNEASNVCIDEKIFKHIIYNLLSNAVKYSPDSDRVDFELICQAKQAILNVRDFGIGISAENQKQLFESFYRADNVGSIPGTGLGLPIVKRSVDLHGGKISVNSIIDRGTTFNISIPYLSRD